MSCEYFWQTLGGLVFNFTHKFIVDSLSSRVGFSFELSEILSLSFRRWPWEICLGLSLFVASLLSSIASVFVIIFPSSSTVLIVGISSSIMYSYPTSSVSPCSSIWSIFLSSLSFYDVCDVTYSFVLRLHVGHSLYYFVSCVGIVLVDYPANVLGCFLPLL